MSKRTFAVILTLLCSFCIGQALAGGIVLQRTRVIYDASRKEAALPVANKGAETPYLLQSWVDNIDGKSRAPFIITPPLFRLEAGDDSSLRIIKTADNLPENKESLFYINVRAIPAKKKSDDVNANELTLVFKTRIKMFYRPAHLKGRVNDAWNHWNLNVVTIHSIYITQLNITSYLPDWQSIKPISQAKLNISRPENINSYHFLHLAERT